MHPDKTRSGKASLPELDAVERWMQVLITHADGVSSGLRHAVAGDILPYTEANLEELVLPSKQLTAVQRLSIYNNMYFERLIEIMADEFPTVQHLLGKKLFATTAIDYVSRHPSTHYSLNMLGIQFPEFLADEAADFPARGFTADVATVEREMENVFDEHQVEPMRFEDLANIPLESWTDVQLQTIPALRLLELAWPVNDYISAVRDGQTIDVPGPALTWIAIYRQQYRVLRMDLDVQRYTLLTALQRGENIGTALDLCAALPDTDPDRLMADIGNWFRDWTSTGLFSRATLAPA